MKLSIKRVAPGDIGALIQLVSAMQAERPTKYPIVEADDIEKLAFKVLSNVNNPTSLTLIAFDGKKPAGFFMGQIATHPFGKPETVGIAQELWVVPGKRGEQIEGGLLRHAFTAAQQAGAQGFEATGTAGGTDQYWLKLGFKPYLSYMYLPSEEPING